MASFNKVNKETDSERKFKEALLNRRSLSSVHITNDDIKVQSLKSDVPHSEELFMVTTTIYDENPEFNRMTRGAIWTFDGDNIKLLYPSLGYPKEIVADSVEYQDNEDGTRTFTVGGEEFQAKHHAELHVCTEGFVVRMAVYKGVELLMTHSNIEGLRFKWGSVRLSDVATKLGLPTHKELFGELGPDDITECVHFMMTADGTVSGTRHDFSENGGYITWLGSNISGVVDYKKKVMKFKDIKFEDFDGTLIKEPLGVINPIPLDLEQANHMLEFGYREAFDYNPTFPELLPGEAVMLIIDSEHMIKVVPPPLKWRNDMRAGDPSIRNRFYHLTANQDLGSNMFLLTMGNLSNVKDLIKEGPLVRINVHDYNTHQNYLKRLTTDHYERVRVFYFNYIFSLPPAEQRRYTGLYEEYVSSCDKLVNFFLAYHKKSLDFINPKTLPELGTINATLNPLPGHTYHKGKDNMVYDITEPLSKNPRNYIVLLEKPHKRIDNILSQAYKFTRSKIRGRVSDAHFDNMLMKNIRFLISKEHGDTKYQMIRQCDAWVLKDTMIKA